MKNISSSWTTTQLEEFVKKGLVLSFSLEESVEQAMARADLYFGAARLHRALETLALACFLNPKLLPESDLEILRHQIRHVHKEGVFDVKNYVKFQV